MNKKICIVYTHHKLGDLIWQLPYIKAISEHHNEKIDLIVRKKTQAQNILRDLNHINKIYYNDFRKGLAYWIDVFKLKKIFNLEKYDFVYILDKVNKPAIAAKLAGIKNIIAPGLRNQKKWITVKNYLNEEDWKLNYSEQSQKFLKINSIDIKEKFPKLEVNTERFKDDNSDLLVEGKKIAFGVDSFEDFKMWYEEDFIQGSHDTISLHRKKMTNTLYTINALNDLIRELNGGRLDKSYQINWEDYQNCLLLTNENGLNKIPTKIYTIIDTKTWNKK